MNEIQANTYLQLEIAELKAENTRLRKKLKENSRHARRVEKAYQDALLLASFAQVRIYPSRSYCLYKEQMPQRRWQNAIALLRLARVINGSRKWSVTDLATIGLRLETARQRAIEQPEAYRARLPRHGTR